VNYNKAQRRELRYQGIEAPVYIVGQSWHFEWLPREIEKVSGLYEDGLHLADIARQVDRSPWDTMMLLVDLAERGLVKKRPGNLWGTSAKGG